MKWILIFLISTCSVSFAQVQCPYAASTNVFGPGVNGCVTNWSPTTQAVMAPNGSAAQFNSMVSAPPPGVSVSACVCYNGAGAGHVGFPEQVIGGLAWLANMAGTYCVADQSGNQGFTYNGYCLRDQSLRTYTCDFYAPGGTCTVYCPGNVNGIYDCSGNAVPHYCPGCYPGSANPCS